MKIMPNVLTDKGSKYAVSGGAVVSKDAANAFLKQLKRNKKFAKATHNTWALLLSDGTAREKLAPVASACLVAA